jgi:glycerophosphoryl diester phosphodiesterase
MIFPSVDAGNEDQLKTVLKEMTEIGVDGVMTDYPEKVVRLLRSLNLRE